MQKYKIVRKGTDTSGKSELASSEPLLLYEVEGIPSMKSCKGQSCYRSDGLGKSRS